MKATTERPGAGGARERTRGARLGRFTLRMLGVYTDPAAYLAIFQHCTILRAEHSFTEGGIEYFALSPRFAPVTDADGVICDRDVPRYEWECHADDSGRIYAAHPVRLA